MRVFLHMEEVEQAIEDYLMKQGLTLESKVSILFNKRDGSLNYDVDKVEIYVKTK